MHLEKPVHAGHSSGSVMSWVRLRMEMCGQYLYTNRQSSLVCLRMNRTEKVVALVFSACAANFSIMDFVFAQNSKGNEADGRTGKSVQNAFLRQDIYRRLLDNSSSVSREFLDKNIQASSATIRRDPKAAEAYTIRGLAYWRLEDSRNASLDLEKAFALSPSIASPGMMLILAECFAEQNNNAKAIQILTKAINSSEATSLLYLRRAQAYSQAKDYKAALLDAEKVVAMNPRQRWAIELRGNLCLSAGKYENAVRDFSECIKLSPQEGKLYANRAAAYDGLGKKAQALADRKRRDDLNRDLGY